MLVSVIVSYVMTVFISLLLLHEVTSLILPGYPQEPVSRLPLLVEDQKIQWLCQRSAATGSTTFNGLVLAPMMPRIFGMRCSAIPFWQLITTGSFTLFVSSPPSISRIAIAVSILDVKF